MLQFGFKEAQVEVDDEGSAHRLAEFHIAQSLRVSMNIRPLEITAKWVAERMVKTEKDVLYRDFYGGKKKRAD